MKGLRALLAAAGLLAALPALPQPVGSEIRVNTITSGDQDSAGIGMDATGAFVVTWRGHALSNDDNGVRLQRFAPGGAPSGIEYRATPSTSEPFVNGGVSVARAPAGGFVVVWGWAYTAGTDLGVFGRRYDSSGAALGAEFRVNTYLTGTQANPQVDTDGTGAFVVTWVSRHEDGNENGVFGRRYSAAGVELGDQFRVNTYTTDRQEAAHVAVSPNGDFVVVWTTWQQDGFASVFGQRFGANGAPRGGEFRVNTYAVDYNGEPTVAADASRFVVSWKATYLAVGGADIRARPFSVAGVPLGAELRVNTTTSGYQTWIDVAAAGGNGFVIVWVAGPQKDNLVLGRRLTASGSLLGNEFRVSTNTTNHKYYAQVAANGNGTYAATWASLGQDGDVFGIYAQLFGGPVLLRGDADGNGARNVSDILYLINNLFAGGPAPVTACGGDADSSNTTNVSDVLFLINYLFAGGPTPGPC